MKIINIKKKKGKFRVYNIETERNNNYFANGVLVHNCFAYVSKASNSSFSGKLHSINEKSFISTIHGKPKGHRMNYFISIL